MKKTAMCLSLIIVILSQTPIYAEEFFTIDRGVKMTLEEKKEDAELIVKGKVESMSSKDGKNKTDYCERSTARIRIQEIIKGETKNQFIDGQYLCCPREKIGTCYKVGVEDTFYLSLSTEGKIQGKEDYTILA